MYVRMWSMQGIDMYSITFYLPLFFSEYGDVKQEKYYNFTYITHFIKMIF